MTWAEFVQFVGSIAGAVALVGVAWISFVGNTRTKEREVTAAPYAELARELTAAREEVAASRKWRNDFEQDYDQSRRVILVLLDERPPSLALHPEVRAWLQEHFPHRLAGQHYFPSSAGTPASIIEPQRPHGPVDNP